MSILDIKHELSRLYKEVQKLEIYKTSPPNVNRSVKEIANSILARVENINDQKFYETFLHNKVYVDVNGICKLQRAINERFKHIVVGGGFKRWFMKSSTEQALSKLSQALSFITPEQNRKYDMQTILRISNDSNSAAKLIFNGVYRGLKTDVVNFKDPLEPLKKLTHNSRLYIVAHGNPEKSVITSGEGERYSVKDIVNAIKTNAPQLQMKEEDLVNGKRIKISLQICNSVFFADELSKALYQAGIPAEVIGRKGLTNMKYILFSGSKKAYRRVVDEKHQQSGSKISKITMKNARGYVHTFTKDVYSRKN